MIEPTAIEFHVGVPSLSDDMKAEATGYAGPERCPLAPVKRQSARFTFRAGDRVTLMTAALLIGNPFAQSARQQLQLGTGPPDEKREGIPTRKE